MLKKDGNDHLFKFGGGIAVNFLATRAKIFANYYFEGIKCNVINFFAQPPVLASYISITISWGWALVKNGLHEMLDASVLENMLKTTMLVVSLNHLLTQRTVNKIENTCRVIFLATLHLHSVDTELNFPKSRYNLTSPYSTMI